MTGARYHKVFTRLWSSPGFRSAPDDQRLAMLFVLTCRHRNTEGLFTLPLPLAAHELAWPIERTRAAFDALEGAGFIAVDLDVDLVWLINAVAWNAPRGEKQLRGAVNVLAETPDSFLQAHYLVKCRELCPELAALIASDLRWSDTPSIPLRYPMGITIRISSSISSSNSSSNSSSSSSSSGDEPEPPPAPTPADPALVRLVELADDLIETLGIVGAVANEGERKLVARALARGWTEAQLLEESYDVASRDNIDSPRRYLGRILRRLANTDPPSVTLTAMPTAERRGALFDERPACDHCDGSGMVGGIGDDGRPEPVSPCPACHVLGATA